MSCPASPASKSGMPAGGTCFKQFITWTLCQWSTGRPGYQLCHGAWVSCCYVIFLAGPPIYPHDMLLPGNSAKNIRQPPIVLHMAVAKLGQHSEASMIWPMAIQRALAFCDIVLCPSSLAPQCHCNFSLGICIASACGGQHWNCHQSGHNAFPPHIAHLMHLASAAWIETSFSLGSLGTMPWVSETPCQVATWPHQAVTPSILSKMSSMGVVNLG